MLLDDALQYTAEWLLNDEDYRQFPYDDATGKPLEFSRMPGLEGYPSIGIGFNLVFTGLSLPESLMILRVRLSKLDIALSSALPWYAALDPVRTGAMLNLGYNLGLDGILGFDDMLAFMAVSDYLNASKALMRSMAAAENHYRYERLSESLLTGKYPSFIQVKEQKACT
jgi:lysozyme